MKKNIKEIVEKQRDEIISSTQEIVRVKSVESSPEKNMPFGEGVNNALETFLNMAERLGLETVNVDGYAGYIEIGEGEEMLGLLCHLDVVPEGKDWTYPPYAAEIHDGKIYGRGTIDDKGPAVSSLYALKAVIDSGIKLNKRVRLIVGTDEESGWEGLDYYLEHEEEPDFAFSPDAAFPVIHAEKGILIFDLKGEYKIREDAPIIIESIEGGNAPNMVPDYCEALLKIDNTAKFKTKFDEFKNDNDFNLEYEEVNSKIKIISQGISAHGSMPEDGQNAISQLMVFLGELGINSKQGKLIEFYNNKIAMEYNGESMNCGLSDGVSGKLVFNVGMIDFNIEKFAITVNIRYPVTKSKEEVYKRIEEEIKGIDLSIEEKEDLKPLYLPVDDPFVEKLMKIYRDKTGDDTEAIAIGGGTYARAVKKGVAFGPLFPGEPELAHQKDEHIKIENLIISTEIYAEAIIELATK